MDEQFQKAGFAPERVVEIHGSNHHLQCCMACDGAIWSADKLEMEVNTESFRATSALPACPACGGMARPNILMFADHWWLGQRTAGQRADYGRWLESIDGKRLVVVECGAGTAIPSIRMMSSNVADSPERKLIRVNPKDYGVDDGEIALPVGALDGIQKLFAP